MDKKIFLIVANPIIESIKKGLSAEQVKLLYWLFSEARKKKVERDSLGLRIEIDTSKLTSEFAEVKNKTKTQILKAISVHFERLTTKKGKQVIIDLQTYLEWIKLQHYSEEEWEEIKDTVRDIENLVEKGFRLIAIAPIIGKTKNGDGVVAFWFHPLLYPVLINFSKGYTRLELKILASLEREESIRLYELAKKRFKLKKFFLDLENTLIAFGAVKIRNGKKVEILKSYKLNPRLFYSRKIKPALEEVNKKSDIEVTVKRIYKKSKLLGFEFEVKTKSIPILESLAKWYGFGNKKALIEELRMQLKKLPISLAIAFLYHTRQKGLKDLERILSFLKKFEREGIKNPEALFRSQVLAKLNIPEYLLSPDFELEIEFELLKQSKKEEEPLVNWSEY
jgi:hypothetical protein